MAKVLVLLADGFEELEAVTVIDLLRRADIPVCTASLSSQLAVTSCRNIELKADSLLDDVDTSDYDMLVLPGGQPGSDNLNQDQRVHHLIPSLFEQNKYIAAICAAPMVLATAGILSNKSATSYPDVLNQWTDIHIVNQPVVVDGTIITSQGPATAMQFAFTLIEMLTNADTRQKIAKALLI